MVCLTPDDLASVASDVFPKNPRGSKRSVRLLATTSKRRQETVASVQF